MISEEILWLKKLGKYMLVTPQLQSKHTAIIYQFVFDGPYQYYSV